MLYCGLLRLTAAYCSLLWPTAANCDLHCIYQRMVWHDLPWSMATIGYYITSSICNYPFKRSPQIFHVLYNCPTSSYHMASLWKDDEFHRSPNHFFFHFLWTHSSRSCFCCLLLFCANQWKEDLLLIRCYLSSKWSLASFEWEHSRSCYLFK